MPARAPTVAPADQQLLARLGERIRAARKRQRVSSVAAAEAAGISRVTLHRIERGEGSVAMGAWVAASAAVGLRVDMADPHAPSPALPGKIRLRSYPELKKLAWQLQGVDELTPQEALDLYERNWRHVDRGALTPRETALIEALARELGGGRLLV